MSLFQTYINCVYFGLNMKEQWTAVCNPALTSDQTDEQKQEASDALFAKQVELYMLARRLDDYKTANTVIDEIIKFSSKTSIIPGQWAVSHAYTDETDKDEPLRMLFRDLWAYDAVAADKSKLQENGFPYHFMHELSVALFEAIRVDRDRLEQSVADNCSKDFCHYHLHDGNHPRCVPEDSDEDQGE